MGGGGGGSCYTTPLAVSLRPPPTACWRTPRARPERGGGESAESVAGSTTEARHSALGRSTGITTERSGLRGGRADAISTVRPAVARRKGSSIPGTGIYNLDRTHYRLIYYPGRSDSSDGSTPQQRRRLGAQSAPRRGGPIVSAARSRPAPRVCRRDVPVTLQQVICSADRAHVIRRMQRVAVLLRDRLLHV